MQLLTIDEIISSILEETEGLDAEITDGIILSKKEIPPSEIEKLKSELGIEYLESTFSEYILGYNWGNFGFLSYQFGYGDETSLSWLINRNLDYDEYPVLHKKNLIIIANGDPYTILLECKSGEIYAFTSDMSYEEIVPVASDFEEFVRAMGTAEYAVWKNAEKEFIESIERECSESGLKFWKELVSVY
ncbi:MAG: SMI1/KNR4 family protein [Mogibacterium diversum]|uniref:SMI1/KNR4 family protein n=1 Tax=Mogibacterium diversum TaxID=114527 RepID=UPI002067E033|nr:SMI1/KNR4 family protein [Mogibacterium diversum]UQF81529.1 MAG: SMI1/KNR4 family protein [Mogibacterium diversum]